MDRIVVFLAAMAAVLWASGASAWSLAAPNAEFRRVDDRAMFVQIVNGRALKRFGITLQVAPDGQIGGRAFGQTVRGAWQWRDGFFCRELYWGSTEIGANCQQVEISGDLVRFTSDYGQGEFADLRLRRAN